MMLPRRDSTKRSIDLASEPGLTSQDTDDTRQIQEALDELQQMQAVPRLVTSPEELYALDHEIRQRTDHLCSLFEGYQLMQALASTHLQSSLELLESHLS